ncbi:MAG: autotransporter assembly complex family protein [Rhodanobacteraceae bacterium]
MLRCARPRPRTLACLALIFIAASVHAEKIRAVVDGVEQPLKAAVLATLEVNQYANRGDVSETQARRLTSDAVAQAKQALQPYGYYNAQVSSKLEHDASGWIARVQVAPGPTTRVAQLDLWVQGDAHDLRPVRQALRTFHPQTGETLDDARYEQSKSRIANALAENGYLDAKATAHRVEVTRADNRADIHLHYLSGPRYRFGAVSFEGSQFRPGFLQRYVPWQQGDWYTQADLLKLQQELTDADYFSLVDVQPDIEDAHDDKVPVKVNLVPAKRHVYTAGVFVGTDTGPGVRGGVQWRWINDRGHKLKTEALLAQRLKNAQVTYEIPRPGPYHRSFNFGVGYRDENTDTSQSRTLSLAANETRDWHGFVRTVGVHFLTGTFAVGGTRGENINDAGIEHGRTTLVYPEVSLAKKVADDPLFVRRGWSINLIARAAPGIDTRFAQLLADAKWIRAFDGRNRLILRGNAGITSVGDFDKLPPELRFFAGGAQSIRGYAYQTIGPRNAFDRVVGGTHLLVGSATLEHYFTPKWGGALFVDSGDAFDGSNFHAHTGVGAGVRWRSPIGLVRVDLGVPVGDSRHSGVQLHIAIGPDL